MYLTYDINVSRICVLFFLCMFFLVNLIYHFDWKCLQHFLIRYLSWNLNTTCLNSLDHSPRLSYKHIKFNFFATKCIKAIAWLGSQSVFTSQIMDEIWRVYLVLPSKGKVDPFLSQLGSLECLHIKSISL